MIELEFLEYNSKTNKYQYWIYYTCSKIRLTENVFPLTPILTRKHNKIFGTQKDKSGTEARFFTLTQNVKYNATTYTTMIYSF